MKTIYYSNELEDDFASTQAINTKPLPDNYKWIHNGILWKIFSAVLYYLIAFPLIKIINRFYYGIRIKNRRVIKKLHSGCFLYSNHTQHLDPFIAAEVSGWGHRTYFMAGADAFSISGIRHLVTMLGAMPVAYDLDSMRKMVDAVTRRYHEGSCITIYPEAHIWPYYTNIRNFPNASFAYPVGLDAPVVAMAVTYRKRRGLTRLLFRHPCITVYCSDPMYANPSLSKRAAKKDLRDRVYNWMKKTAEENNKYEYIHYEYKKNDC
ncbi:MAG: lysophospholipid acyltransferase family protein [Eubacterium sp.]